MEKTKIIKCSKCRRFIDVPEGYLQKCCPDCLDKLRRAYQKKQLFKPSKEDIQARERIQQERQGQLELEFGSTMTNCIRWRTLLKLRLLHGKDFIDELNLASDAIELWLNHPQSCQHCASWFVAKKSDPLDLNLVGTKRQSGVDELQGYAEFLKSKPPLEESVRDSMGEIHLMKDITEQSLNDPQLGYFKERAEFDERAYAQEQLEKRQKQTNEQINEEIQNESTNQFRGSPLYRDMKTELRKRQKEDKQN